MHGLTEAEWDVVAASYTTVLSYTNGCAGFDTACMYRGVGNTSRFLDQAAARNVTVILSIKDLYPSSPANEASWRALVSAHEGHPALLGWYVLDERPADARFPFDRATLEMLAARRAALRAFDPEHLAVAVVNRWKDAGSAADAAGGSMGGIGVYANVSDLIGVDPYPWRNATETPDLGTEAWELRDLTRAYGGAKGADPAHATLCVAQLFSWGAYKPPSLGWDEPPYAVKRAMTWMQPVAGCGGVLHFNLYDQYTQTKHPPTKANASTVSRRLAEMRRLGAEIAPHFEAFASWDRRPELLEVQGAHHVLAALLAPGSGGRDGGGGTLYLVNYDHVPTQVSVRVSVAGGGWRQHALDAWGVAAIPVTW